MSFCILFLFSILLFASKFALLQRSSFDYAQDYQKEQDGFYSTGPPPDLPRTQGRKITVAVRIMPVVFPCAAATSHSIRCISGALGNRFG